jgi:hypothetical protein
MIAGCQASDALAGAYRGPIRARLPSNFSDLQKFPDTPLVRLRQTAAGTTPTEE